MMDFTAMKSLLIDGVALTKLSINGVQVWALAEEETDPNRIPTSIDTDGSIYNGKGYKQGYRIRSGGAEAAASYVSCTGFIKVDPGDVVRISGIEFSVPSNGNAINVSDANFTNLGQFTMQPVAYGIFASSYSAYNASSVVEESTGVWKWVVPPAASGVAYIRLTCQNTTIAAGPTDMVLTINEEIT